MEYISLISDGQYVTFKGMKFHFISIWPCKKFFNIALQNKVIFRDFNFPPYFCIISIEQYQFSGMWDIHSNISFINNTITNTSGLEIEPYGTPDLTFNWEEATRTPLWTTCCCLPWRWDLMNISIKPLINHIVICIVL